jgi:hypothetical protein
MVFILQKSFNDHSVQLHSLSVEQLVLLLRLDPSLLPSPSPIFLPPRFHRLLFLWFLRKIFQPHSVWCSSQSLSLSTLPDSFRSFSSKLTGAGLLLLHAHDAAHRRLCHLHDRNLKFMIDCGMCTSRSLTLVPGIVIASDFMSGSGLRFMWSSSCPLAPL